MNNNCLKGIASFMVALIICIPIYSSSVLAMRQGLQYGSVYGSDNVNGVYKQYEEITIDVTARFPDGRVIEPSDVLLFYSVTSGLGDGVPFDSCTPLENEWYECSYSMSANFQEDEKKFYLRLYNNTLDANSPVIPPSVTLVGYYDNVLPTVDFSVNPSGGNSGQIRLAYNVYDRADIGTDDKCSGLSRLEIYSTDKTEIVRSIPLGTDVHDCMRDGPDIVFNIDDIVDNSIDGERIVDITLKAYDNLDGYSEEVRSFSYDRAGPTVDETSLSIVGVDGEEVSYVGASSVDVIVSFMVTSNDLDDSSVMGDLSGININSPSSYSDVSASCTRAPDGGFGCIFNPRIDLDMELSSSTSVVVSITMEDLYGNTNTVDLSKDIIYDGDGPEVTSIVTGRVSGDVNYVNESSNTFIVQLTESGIGIDSDDILLDLSGIGLGSSVAADECDSSGSTFTCYWNGIDPASSVDDGDKTIIVSGSDKAGNPVTGSVSGAVKLDTRAPSITGSSVDVIGGGGEEAIEGIIRTGDSLDITLTVTEANPLGDKFADFSDFVVDEESVSGECSSSTGGFDCVFSSSAIDVPGYISSNVDFSISDAAGNTRHYSEENIEVLENDDAESINYWISNVDCSPKLVDRQVTDLISTRVYCAISLSPVGADQETLSIDFNYEDCTNVENDSLAFVSDIQMVNADRGSTEPYLSIDLIKGEMTTDKLSFICPIFITSKAGNKVTANQEEDLIKVDINFYNNPLGEFGQNVQDRINDAKDDAFGGIWKIIGLLKTVMHWATLACNALQTMQKFTLLFNLKTDGITTAHIATIGTPVEELLGPAKAGMCKAEGKFKQASEKSYAMFDKQCKFINCQTSPKAPSGEGGGGTGIFSTISDRVGSWNFNGNELLGKAAIGGGAMSSLLSVTQTGGGSGTIEEYFGKQPYQYMNAKDNLLVALLLGCIPGIINGLDKYRQILCLYADCLENNAVNNVPVKICDDQKKYATCKYIYGEIFAVLPHSALFDYYINMVKGALSDPLTAIATAFNVFTKGACVPYAECDASGAASIKWKAKYQTFCAALQIATLLGEIVGDVTGIIDTFDAGEADYCERIDD
jgi:hypothetical protein